jgi:hypothetical protein
MSSMLPTPVGDSCADSEDPWAKAFKSLSEVGRKEFADTGSDMLGTRRVHLKRRHYTYWSTPCANIELTNPDSSRSLDNQGFVRDA